MLPARSKICLAEQKRHQGMQPSQVLLLAQRPILWDCMTYSHVVYDAAGEGASKPVSRCASMEGMGSSVDSPVASSVDESAMNGFSHSEPCQDAPLNGRRHGK